MTVDRPPNEAANTPKADPISAQSNADSEVNVSGRGLWFVSFGIVACAALASLWAYFMLRLGGVHGLSSPGVLAKLGAAPTLALGVSLVLRHLARRPVMRNPASGAAGLVSVWLTTFAFVVHAGLIATLLGILTSLRDVASALLGLLLFGIGFLVRTFEFGEAFGFRTRATLSSEAAWRSAHRVLSRFCMAAGVLGTLGLFLSPLGHDLAAAGAFLGASAGFVLAERTARRVAART